MDVITFPVNLARHRLFHDIKAIVIIINRKSNICAYLILNSLNTLKKNDKMLNKASQLIKHFVSIRSINSKIINPGVQIRVHTLVLANISYYSTKNILWVLSELTVIFAHWSMYTSIWWYLRVLPVLHRPEVVDTGV